MESVFVFIISLSICARLLQLEECVLSLCVSDAGSWMFDDLLSAELIYLGRNRRGRERLELKM